MGRQRNSRKTEKPNPPAADEAQNPNVAPVDESNETQEAVGGDNPNDAQGDNGLGASDKELEARIQAIEERAAQLEERERELDERNQRLDERAQGLVQSEDAFRAHIEKVEAQLETKGKAMLTTETMPGGTQDDPQEPLIILPPQKQPETTQPCLYTDKDLGKCERTVSLRRGAAAERQVMHLTFKPNCVYELVLIRGRAKVPQEIAVYIQKNNPGGNLIVN